MEEAAIALKKEAVMLRAVLGILGINRKNVRKTPKNSVYGIDNKLDRIKTKAILNMFVSSSKSIKKDQQLKNKKSKFDRADNIPHVKSEFVANSRQIFKSKK